jgi:hydrogenase maturation factor
MGKISSENLKRLLRCIKKDSRIIVPPSLGLDSGVHLLGDKYIVVSTDPCIGVPREWFGWLLIHYASSDVALFGAKPEFCTINLLGSPSTDPQVFLNIMKQACDAADELELAIVTGHTGTYDGLSALVGICTVYGSVDKKRLITPGSAKPGDYIICIKPIGMETAINFSLIRKALALKLFGVKRTQELTELVSMQSCVKEALLLAEIEGVHAMHDITEGGFTAALNEMAEASKVGFQIDFNKIPIPNEIRTLQENFKLSDEQVLAMSSTGTILASVSPKAKEDIERVLRKRGLKPRYIGAFTETLQRVLLKNGKAIRFSKKADDPYARIISGKS